MGARASVILKKSGEANSPVLCQHWGGSKFHESIREWVATLYAESNKERTTGKVADRLEPNRVFIKMVRLFGEGGYVECDPIRVDDSDYGCLCVHLGEDSPTFNW